MQMAFELLGVAVIKDESYLIYPSQSVRSMPQRGWDIKPIPGNFGGLTESPKQVRIKSEISSIDFFKISTTISMQRYIKDLFGFIKKWRLHDALMKKCLITRNQCKTSDGTKKMNSEQINSNWLKIMFHEHWLMRMELRNTNFISRGFFYVSDRKASRSTMNLIVHMTFKSKSKSFPTLNGA